jgi:hypothetical protein
LTERAGPFRAVTVRSGPIPKTAGSKNLQMSVMAMFQQLAVNGCMVTHRRHTYGYQREAWGIILPLGPGQPGRSCTGG